MVDNSAQIRWDAIYSDAPEIGGADPFVQNRISCLKRHAQC